MRIGLVIYGSIDTVSGGYLYDRKLVEYLRAQGDHVEIVSLPWRRYLLHLTDNLSASWFEQLETLDVDLLLQDELNHPSLFWMNHRLRQRVSYPIVSIVHHLRASETHPSHCLAIYRQIEQKYLESVDGFIYNSLTTRKAVHELLEENGRVSTNEVVAYPAADHLDVPEPAQLQALIQSRSHSDGPLRILFVGNLIERKGLHDLLGALVQLPQQSWSLTVVGSPDVDQQYTDRVRKFAIERELSNPVEWAGSVSNSELQEFYKRNHLLVVPSYEGFGIVYLEAMSFGLPVIASTAGAAHEIVSLGKNGFLVEPGDVMQLAHWINVLHNDRDLLQQMSLAARQHYDEHPAWEQSAAQIHHWLHTTWVMK